MKIAYLIKSSEEFDIFCKIYPYIVVEYGYIIKYIKDWLGSGKYIAATFKKDGKVKNLYYLDGNETEFKFQLVDFKVFLRRRKLEMLNNL